ncbi:type I DNA topoisomerase [Pseudobutyrivibrio sp.]|uniref:type I DNA topoisomerase n=1 Tax=Pseudobutyrivibrio sp. TaxID=2014367 RepID=UPI0025E6E63B|nr:type I DNA topoisomerase [Pseudobutyrivibrio sp.]
MAKNLVIVESPAKVHTIKKFLGSNYEVMASQGHVRDMPKSQLGFDPENDFEPKYITIRGKGELLAALRKEVKKADKIYLATDPDREGEAISWHLTHALNLQDKKVYRITFNEITKTAVKNSLKNPREIDMDLVDAQQARRMLDRMVGYKISPLLWAKVKRGLSAGRVQSVALRIICDREKEIDQFIPQEYYTLDVLLDTEGSKKPIVAKYYGDKTGKKDISDKASLDKIMEELKGAEFSIASIKRGTREKKAPLPFTTSTMQQEASKALNFSIQKTMSVAQQLYEGVSVKGHGTIGLITYLRTDSTRVSDEARAAAESFITSNYGDNYLSAPIASSKKNSGKVQDAHEAIRPANIELVPSEIKDSLTRDQYRLYQLVWKRFVASQMANAVYDTVSLNVQAKDQVFTAAESAIKFDGFMMIYVSADDEEDAKTHPLSKLTEDSKLSFNSFDEKQHFTQPLPHFTEASLVKTLEELGIGRPSTYSPTITTLIKRHYITKEAKNLFVTELGEVVNSIMEDSFPIIVDDKFTANLELLLDGVEEGTVEWKSVVRNFYPDLEKAVKVAEDELAKIEIHDEVTDVICEECGRNMVIKFGPHGKFLACPGFPECRNTKPFLEKVGVPCPKCGGDVVIRKSQKGRKFYGCANHPECDFISWSKPTVEKCPKCGTYMVEKGNKLVCANDECRFVQSVNKE